jgi:hypothetical protein
VTPGERAESAVISFLTLGFGNADLLHGTHIPDDAGNCLGCLTQMAPVKHPCIIRQLADSSIFRRIPLQRKPMR